ncbi:MAG: helix-turn-helix domain-containing protein [Opitutaceae bacterium]|nr:helix-turn-helix domain-containing protein [Opitutaceae bacterium]
MAEDQATASPEIHGTPETLWTVSNVARFFGCTVRHVINLQANGLPHFYLGRLVRFDPAEVREFLKTNRRIAATKSRRAARSHSVPSD